MIQSFPRGTPQSEIDQRVARFRTRLHPDHLPAYFRIQVDGAGRIWVEDYPTESPFPRPWTVFDSTGPSLGRVLFPEIPGSEAGDIASIGDNEVLIAWRDEELGFAHLTVHALEPVK